MARLDPHSYADSDHPLVEHVAWKARVDFAERAIAAEVELRLAGAGAALDLDTRGLTIEEVSARGRPLRFALHPPEPILGARLSVELPAGTRTISIRYRAARDASALQWLAPEQTAGGRAPYLFSQCQAIHARSLLPIQDTPRVRIRYRAELDIPASLRSLMAAAACGREEAGGRAIERWEMPQPIPPYLFAFAVGNLASRELGARSRVWAEPEVVERAAWEFAEVDQMLSTAERLFGPYPWERWDLLTMPPSFPYGGMENPRLTFLTPTLIAGDRSLVAVLAHELAHSWTGNLVSNANAEHFWLNEGFTVFAERRIVRALKGAEAAELQAALGRRELDRAVERFARDPGLTRLRTRLSGVDPDEAFSEVPYEKGYLFLRAIEAEVGEAAFDQFLKRYVEKFRFTAITTEDFERLVEEVLPGVLARVDASAWLDGPGVPSTAPAPRSSRLAAVETLGTELPSVEQAKEWSPTEWELYLSQQPHPSPPDRLRALDERFRLSTTGNAEVLVAWIELAVASGTDHAADQAAELLGRVGRMKYLRPLYLALKKRDPERARRTFTRLRARYHPIAQQVVEALLAA
jgi:leukotriene A-4 hydrolase/aminopeptidase